MIYVLNFKDKIGDLNIKGHDLLSYVQFIFADFQLIFMCTMLLATLR